MKERNKEKRYGEKRQFDVRTERITGGGRDRKKKTGKRKNGKRKQK